jgi:hypothetical protein
MTAAIRLVVLAETGADHPHQALLLTTRILAVLLLTTTTIAITTTTMKGPIRQTPRHRPISSLLTILVPRCLMKGTVA